MGMQAMALFLALLVVAAAGAPPAMAGGNPSKGAQLFRICMSCHRIGPGAANLVGPELNGVVGRKAGIIEGYAYSNANKTSGITWDEATLTLYLRSPKGVVPGTFMSFAGFSKDDQIADVIAYLKTFDPGGNPVVGTPPQ
jgi:cytochrome c